MATVNLNHVKKIESGSKELNELKVGDQIIWKKITASILVSNIAGGKRISFSKTEGPLKHNLYTRKSTSDDYSSSTSSYDVKTVSSGTAGVMVGIDTDHIIYSGTQAWSVTQAPATIGVSNISGGKRVTFTNTAGSGTMYYRTSTSASWSSTASLTATADLTSVSSGTAQVYVTGASGYANASTSSLSASQAWSVTQLAQPTISVTNITGGKRISISLPTNATSITYNYSGAPNTSSSSAVSTDKKTVSSGTAQAYASANGYVSSPTASQAWSVTQATATISVTSITGGKKITISNTAGSGTLYYLYDGSTFSNTSSSSVNTDKTSVSSGTAKAYVTGATGYADGSSSALAASQAWSVTQLANPTISVTASGYNTKTYTISSSSGSILHYNWTTNSSYTTASGNTADKTLTSVSSGTAYAYASQSGYVDSAVASLAWSITQLGQPTIAVTNITSGKRISISKSTNATAIVYNYNGTPDTSSSSNVSTDKTSVSSGTAKAYARASGYMDSAVASQAWSVTKATATIGISNITSGKRLTFTNTAGSGTMYYRSSTSDSFTTATSPKTVDIKSISSGTAQVYITGASGYADASTSSLSADLAWSVTKAPATISVTGISGGKRVTITNTAGSGTLYYLFDGSTYSNTTDASKSTDKTSVSSGTAKAYVTGASGYADASASSLSASQSWEVTQLAQPTISVTNITSGKRISISLPTNATGIYYNYNGDANTNSTSAVSTDKKTVSSGTAKAYAYASTGYVSSAVSSQAWSVTQATASISVSNITSGKRITVTNNAGSGTLYYLYDGSSYSNTSSTSTSTDKTSVSSGTAKAYVTGATGYADGSTSSAASTAWSVTKAPATITVTNIDGGKKITISNTAGSGTMYYLYSGSTYSNTTSASVNNSYTSVTSGTAKAYVTGATGFADASSSSLSASQDWSVTKLGNPTITVTNITSGKRITISKSTNATGIVYNYNGTPDTTSTSNVSTDKTSVSSGTAKAYAYAQGYVSSDVATQSWSITKATATISVTNITGGKRITITNTSGSGTLYCRKATSDSFAAETSPKVYDISTVSSGTAQAYVTGASGYADASTSSLSASSDWSVTLAPATISVSNIAGGKNISISNTAGSGTLYYLYDGSTYSNTTESSVNSDKKTVSSGTAKAYVTGATGYANGSASTAVSKAWSVERLGAPSISVSDITSGKRISISVPTNATSITYNYNAAPDTASSSAVSTDKKTVSSGTAQAYASAPGYVNSETSTKAWSVTKAPATIGLSDIDGGKRLTFTNTAGSGTMYYRTTTSESYSTATSPKTVDKTSVSSGTASVYITGASGYADASTSSLSASKDWSVTKLGNPTINTSQATAANSRTYRISCPDTTATLYVNWTGGTRTSANTYYQDKTSTTVESGTASAQARKNGYVPSDVVSLSWAMTRATVSIAIADIAGGKKATASSSYSGTIQTSKDNSTWGTTNPLEYKSVTTESYAYAKIINVVGYIDSEVVTSSKIVVSRATAPTVTPTDSSNGGKYFAITSSVGGTINFSVTGGFTQTGTGASTNNWTNTTATTCNAWVTAAPGYADATSSAGNASKTETLTRVSNPAWSTADITGGKTLTLSRPSGITGGTLRYKVGSGSWTTYSAAFPQKTAATVYARLINVPGYANSLEDASTSVGYYSPTVQAKDSSSGGKYYSITKAAAGTLHYTVTGGLVVTETTTTATTAQTTSNWKTTTATVCNAWCTGMSGYADASASVGNVSVSTTLAVAAKPTVTPTNSTSGGKYFALSSSVGGTINFSVTGGITQTGTGTSTNNCRNTTATTCNAWVTSAPGYADASSSSNNQTGSFTLTVATKPTVTPTDSNSGGKYFALSSSVGGTINFSVTGGFTQTGTGTSTNNYTGVTATTCNAWVTAAPGYADASSSSNNQTGSFTLTRVSNPAWSTADITGGKTLTLSRPSGITNGTLQYKINSGSWANYSAAFPQKTAATVYAKLINVPGYADSLETSSTSVDYYKATISAEDHNNGGKYFKITKSAAGTLHYAVSGGLTVAETTTTATTTQTTTNWKNTTSAVCNTWCTGVSGYADASSSAGNRTATVVLHTHTPSVNVVANTAQGGKCFRISNADMGGTINFTVTGGITQSGTIAENGYTNTCRNTTKTICNAWVTNLPGYADGSASEGNGSNNFTLVKIAQPATPTEGTTANGKTLTYTAPTKDVNGTNLTSTATIVASSTAGGGTVSGNTVTWTGVASGSCTAYAWAAGYADSDARTGSVEIERATAPTIGYNSAISNGRQYKITSNETTGTLYYKTGSAPSTATDGTTIANNGTVDVTGNTTIYAWVTGVTGEYTSSNATATVPKLNAPSGSKGGRTGGGRQITFTAPGTASDGTTGITGITVTAANVSNGTASGNVVYLSDWTYSSSAKSYSGKAYASKSGYANSDYCTAVSDSVSAATAPSVTESGIAGGKSFWCSTSYTGTPAISFDNSTWYTSAQSKTPTSDTNYDIYTKIYNVTGYLNSDVSTKVTKSITKLSAPTIELVSTDYDYRKYTIACPDTNATLWVNWTGGATSSAGAYYSNKELTSATSSTNAKAQARRNGYISSDEVSNLNYSMSTAGDPSFKDNQDVSNYDSRTYRVYVSSGETLFVDWNNGTPASTGTTYSDKTVTSSDSTKSGTVKAISKRKGYISSGTKSWSWSLPKLANPTINTSQAVAVDSRTYRISGPAGSILYYNWTTNGSFTKASGNTADKTSTSVESGTAYAYASQGGYETSGTASLGWSMTKLNTPTIEIVSYLDGTTGGKYPRFKQTQSGTLYYLSSGSTYANTSTNNSWVNGASASTASSGTAKAYVTKAGYMTSAIAEAPWSVTKLASPTINNSQDVSTYNSRTARVSSASGSTLYIDWAGGTPTSAGANYSDKVMTSVQSGNAKAYAVQSGYETSATVSNLAWSMTKLANPTINNSFNISSYDSRTARISCPDTSATLFVNWTGGTTASVNRSYDDKVMTSVTSGTAKAQAKRGGYMNSDEVSNLAWSMTKLSNPTMTVQSSGYDTKTYRISCPDTSATLFVNWTGGDTSSAGAYYSDKTLTSVSSGTAKAQAKRGGFVSSDVVSNLAWSMTKLANPTLTLSSQDYDYRKYRIACPDTSATLFVHWTNGTPASVSTYYSDKELTSYTASTNAKAQAKRSGYISSDEVTLNYSMPYVSVSWDSDTVDPVTGRRQYVFSSSTSGAEIALSLDGTNYYTDAREYWALSGEPIYYRFRASGYATQSSSTSSSLSESYIEDAGYSTKTISNLTIGNHTITTSGSDLLIS